MSIANINFTGAYSVPSDTQAVNLNFGAQQGTTVDPMSCSVVIEVQAPVMQVTTLYASNVSRPVGFQPDMDWSVADTQDAERDGGWGLAQTDRVYTSLPWMVADNEAHQYAEHSGSFDRHRISDNVVWARASNADAEAMDVLYEELLRNPVRVAVPWQEGNPLARNTGSGFEQLLPFKHNKVATWQDAQYLTAVREQLYNVAQWFARQVRVPWEEARKPASGREVPYVPPVTPPYVPFYNLNFLCKCKFPDALNVVLNFGKNPCPDESGAITDRKVYFIVNTLSLKRVQDDEQIHINSVSVGIDKDSWCWAFNANIPYTELEKVEPTMAGPVEVELEINGLLWRILVEEYDKKEAFAKTDISIKGRSVTAYLESPYAPVRSYTQSAAVLSRQLAEAELTRAGLVTGFSLDWQLVDALGWQMPAGTWSYNDLTPIQVIQAIAQGAGGYVNSHPSQKSLLVVPDYPAPFWEWDGLTPARTIPESLIKNRSLRWMEKPAYNGVYVSGENTGVTALVKRTGTDGAFQAPMYVNPMISHSSAARNKGISLLSAGGKQARVGMDLPMESSLGLVTPGTLIAVQPTTGGAWRGLVRSTNISAAWGGGLTVNQALELERHYGGL